MLKTPKTGDKSGNRIRKTKTKAEGAPIKSKTKDPSASGKTGKAKNAHKKGKQSLNSCCNEATRSTILKEDAHEHGAN